MILTCPRCATRYLADAAQLWTTGRTVQCEACGQRWRASGSGEPPAPPPLTAPEPPAAPESPSVEPVTEPQPQPEPEPEPILATLREEPAPALFLQPTKRPAPVRSRPPWYGPALSILFLLGMTIAVMLLFQDAVVRAFPGAAGVYSTLGLTKLNVTGVGSRG